MLHNLRFFSSKWCLFHNATLFGYCIIHILNTGCVKFKRKFRRQGVNERIIFTQPTSLTAERYSLTSEPYQHCVGRYNMSYRIMHY
jgi:hypothetical protein